MISVSGGGLWRLVFTPQSIPGSFFYTLVLGTTLMQKRYQILLSSIFRDIEAERNVEVTGLHGFLRWPG